MLMESISNAQDHNKTVVRVAALCFGTDTRVRYRQLCERGWQWHKTHNLARNTLGCAETSLIVDAFRGVALELIDII